MPQPQPLTVKQAISRAKKATKQGDTAVALELYTAVLQHQPNNPAAKKGLRKLQKGLQKDQSGKADIANPSQDQINSLVNLYHSGQMVKTEQACKKLIQSCPQSLVVINILGAALQGQGKLQEAVETYEKAIRLKPDYAEAYNNCGAALQGQGKLQEAVESYENAIQLKPDYAEAYNNRGNALQEIGQLEAAVESSEKAIQLKPDYAEAYYNHGNALQEIGQLELAVASYEKAIQLRPDYPEACYNRGNALKKLEQQERAVESYEKAIHLKPDYAEAYYNRGNALQEIGQLERAVESYKKTIQLKPDFAKAYSNLGTALQELGQPKRAVESYEKAIQLKPDYAEAYSNRGNALQEMGQLERAVESCEKAIQLRPDLAEAYNNCGYALQEIGQPERAVESCEKAIQLKPDFAEAYNNRGTALQEIGQLEQAVGSYEKAVQLKPDYAEAYYNFGAALQKIGEQEQAVASYEKAIQLKPDYAEAYNNRGAVIQELGQLERAVESYEKTIQLKPDFAEAYNNRGAALQETGQLERAVESYEKAIELKPDYPEAYNNRGAALQEIGQLERAIVSYGKAIQLKPDYVEAYSNLGAALQEIGQLDEAISSHQKAISINPQNALSWTMFTDVLQVVRLTSYSDELENYLLQAIEQPTVRPVDLSRAIVSALHYHPIVIRALELCKIEHMDEKIDHLAEQISTVPVLIRVMELSPIADLDIEKMLIKMRKAMLHKALNEGGEASGLIFYAALAMHCFVNEYVFIESEEEKQEIALLQDKVNAIIKEGGNVSATRIAVLGSYRALYCFSWAKNLLKYEWADEIKKVIVMQVDNVREEKTLQPNIPRLTSIKDKISQLVRKQYEENPYPRWIKTGLNAKPRRIRQVLHSIKIDLNMDVQQFSDKPNILVAGCGTGQHALYTASRFQDCNVLAMDLSLSSLSYAIRKTQELGITNIEYMQGDILKLDQLERKFDIVESVGVLHHMDDPIAGWKVLVDKLGDGGLMLIGLYSNIARQNIVAARRQIAKKKYTSSPDDIRRYREEIFDMDHNSDSEVWKLQNSTDFYSLSTCRDLLFHIQEHRFTLLQIEEILRNLGLKFLGFELGKTFGRSKFIENYPEKDAIISFPLWHEFELKNPDTFGGMYQFWVQKE
jgi:tetratricopeptide (TPR) repeat protein/SAM-dependent methyltransferase